MVAATWTTGNSRANTAFQCDLADDASFKFVFFFCKLLDTCSADLTQSNVVKKTKTFIFKGQTNARINQTDSQTN